MFSLFHVKILDISFKGMIDIESLSIRFLYKKSMPPKNNVYDSDYDRLLNQLTLRDAVRKIVFVLSEILIPGLVMRHILLNVYIQICKSLKSPFRKGGF